MARGANAVGRYRNVDQMSFLPDATRQAIKNAHQTFEEEGVLVSRVPLKTQTETTEPSPASAPNQENDNSSSALDKTSSSGTSSSTSSGTRKKPMETPLRAVVLGSQHVSIFAGMKLPKPITPADNIDRAAKMIAQNAYTAISGFIISAPPNSEINNIKVQIQYNDILSDSQLKQLKATVDLYLGPGVTTEYVPSDFGGDNSMWSNSNTVTATQTTTSDELGNP
jgi:hypothetical protein